MVVIISTDVLAAIGQYAAALTYYPISSNRAHTKVDNMFRALYALGDSCSVPSVCMHKDLGQEFGSDGKPEFMNLRRFNYKDESRFQWAFACLYDEKEDEITITKMLPANQVKEETQNGDSLILENRNGALGHVLSLMERMDALHQSPSSL